MPSVIYVNPIEGRRKKKVASRKKRKATTEHGRVVRGPRGTQGRKITIDRGSTSGLSTAPRGTYEVNPMPLKRDRRTGRYTSQKRRRRNPETRAERSRAAKAGWAHRRRRRNPETRAERSRAAKAGWAHRRRHTHRRRRNPEGKLIRTFRGALGGALVIPAAMLASDVVYGFVPLPASMKTGTMKPVGKLVVASALGAVAAMTLPAKTAQYATAGLIGGVLYDTAKGYLASAVPTLGLSGLGDSGLVYDNGAGHGQMGAPGEIANAGGNPWLGEMQDVPSATGLGALVEVPYSNNG